MTVLLAPSRDGAALPRIAARRLLAASALACLAAALFWWPLLFGGALHHFDWDSHHFHYFDWVRSSLRDHHTLPLYMADAWVTPNFLANAESPGLGPLVALLFALPTDGYIKLLLVVFTAAGLVGGFFLLRDLEVSAPVAALGAAIYAFNGFFVSHLAVGHHWAMGGYLLPGLVLLFRRAALGSDAALWTAGIVDAFTILGGQHQPFIWQNLVLGLFALLWSIRVRALFPLLRLGLVVAIAGGLAAVKLLPMLAEFSGYDPAARIQGIPLSLLLPTFAARGQAPGLEFSSVVFEHGSGWWEYAFYVGPVALLCIGVGLAATRRAWPLVAIGVFFAAIGIEWTGSLRWMHLWALLEHQPVWSSQRCPSRFFVITVFCLTTAAALGLERLLHAARRGRPRIAWLTASVIAVWVVADLHLESRVWQRAAVGEALASRPHEPRPMRLRRPEAQLELREFAPNRLVYSARASERVTLTLPLVQPEGGGGWRVDGLPGASRQGRLVIDLSPGERDVVMTYRPPLLYAGAAISAATAAVLAVWIAVSRRRRSPAGSSGESRVPA